jgi:hypothetical protein
MAPRFDRLDERRAGVAEAQVKLVIEAVGSAERGGRGERPRVLVADPAGLFVGEVVVVG